MQNEVAPGNWRTVDDPNNSNIPFVLRDAETVTALGDVSGFWFAMIAPGRYRLHYGYQLVRADGASSGEHRTVDSNVFVVIAQ